MKYQQGSFGRVFILKFENNDDLLHEIKQLAAKERIMNGTVMLLGGLRSGGVVSGPKKPVIPPDPMWFNFDDGREVLGFGTVFWQDEEPMLHIHGAIGRGTDTVTGCIRKDSRVYLVVEAVVTEILGVNARRARDEKSGLVMLEL